MKSIVLRANAKINWTLKVVRKREDGYHDLDMLLSSVTLHDRVKITRTYGKGIDVKVWGQYVSGGENNIAYKAAKKFFEAVGAEHACRIEIQKRIPVCAGMGGGSADAAAVLVGLNELFDNVFSTQRLMEIGKTLGADVPFMINGGLAKVEGIGDIISPLDCIYTYNLVGVMPKKGAGTKNIFSKFDINECRDFPDSDSAFRALVSGDRERISESMGNSLEYVTAGLCPDIVKIKEGLRECGAVGTQMTGSGALVFGLFNNDQDALNACIKLRRIGLGRVYKFNTAKQGLEITKKY